MYLVLTQQLAAQHIAELHQQAARHRLIRELRAVPAAPPGCGVSPWMRDLG